MEIMTCPVCACSATIAERNEADTFYCLTCKEWRPCYPECEAKARARARSEQALIDAGTHERI